jgi:ABC-type cobalamin/Fe3+-siderophores transport system ATPase subunit
MLEATRGRVYDPACGSGSFFVQSEKFIAAHRGWIADIAIYGQAPVQQSDLVRYRQWASRISAWLYGTEHIRISHGVQYDGVDIEQLSPGMRGIVLLMLYLAIDNQDDRPLIVDQPEENLDPKSIFDELVQRFRVAKQRRQIIIVTHRNP